MYAYTLNPCLFSSVCPTGPTSRDLANKKNYWSSFVGLCSAPTCRKLLKNGSGIFCANYYARRGPFAPCESAWCYEDFVPLGNKPFPVRKQLDEDGEVLDEYSDQHRFCQGRSGDHLMTPFQCELCHFRNIFGRNPHTLTDREALEFFRRASLDAFWSRASSTVKGNLAEGRRGQKFADRMRVPCLVPEMGPFPLQDTMGMMCAASILDRSLDPGLTEDFVQWATFRGGRSFIPNATQAGVAGLSEVVGGYEKNRVWISKSVTHSFWFSRFMEGLHKRVGEVVRQDEPISIDVLKTIEVILEAEWVAATLRQGPRPNDRLQRWVHGLLSDSVRVCVGRKCC